MRGFRSFIVSILALVLIGAINKTGAATLTTLWQFSGGSDGGLPEAPLIQGFDTNFYGTTSVGTSDGLGIVFRITPTGVLTNLHTFTGGSDGGIPEAGLTQGSDSNFYGTTSAGGSNDVGSVFKITSAGTFTSLWQFGNGPDGGEPQAGLVQGFDGNFYGTTSAGGSNDEGVIYKITSAGALTSLWQFSGGPDGGEPDAGLVQGSDSNFYGTTSAGGTNTGFGTVFKITSQGTLTTLYRFSGGSDGSDPEAGLVAASVSNFYGTTFAGGVDGNGTIFKIASGTFSNVYRFSGSADGANPEAPLVLGSDGNFYGTTSDGGTNSFGNVFKFTSAGTLTTLWQFSGGTDGSFPFAGLVQGIDSLFYGTTYEGGTNSSGVVFKLNPASASANSGPQIASVQIVGTNVVVTIVAVPSDTYQLQFSASMVPASWTNVVGAVTNNATGAVPLIDVGGASHPQRFYRVEVVP